MKDLLLGMLIVAFFVIPIIAYFLPDLTKNLRKEKPLLFYITVIIGTLTVIIVSLNISDVLFTFFKTIYLFIKNGCLIC